MEARPATDEELARFRSLRSADLPGGHFIGDGEKIVRRMLARNVEEMIVLGLPDRVARLDVPAGVKVVTCTRDSMLEIVGYRLHAGLMAMGRIPSEAPISGTLHVALDRLSNAENVGAILRTCAAFGVDGVIVGPSSASPWLRRAVRVSMGAPLVVPVHHVADLAKAIAPLNAWAAHIHGEKRDFLDVDFRKPSCLVLGGEADGVSAEVLAAAKGTIYIPMAEAWDCLNVAASTAVLLAEVARQRRAC